MQTVPAKLTSAMVRHMDVLIKKGVFSSRSEYIRDAVRQKSESDEAKQSIRRMRGALKDRVASFTESMSEWRRHEWMRYLQEAGGDEDQALSAMRADEEKTLAKIIQARG